MGIFISVLMNCVVESTGVITHIVLPHHNALSCETYAAGKIVSRNCIVVSMLLRCHITKSSIEMLLSSILISLFITELHAVHKYKYPH